MRITELCRSELESHVEKVFELERIRAILAEKEYATVPYIGDLFLVAAEFMFPHYKRLVCAALFARNSFEQQKPPWAPSLPLSDTDVKKLLRDEDPRLSLLGYFAASWACANWHRSHPPFFVYASGVMACPHTPEHIRTDPRLLRDYPPTLLTELNHALCWNTGERIIDFMQQIMRQEEHFYRCNMLVDADRMRGIIKQLTGEAEGGALWDGHSHRPPSRA
jgi:hypothetical protein